MITVAIKAPNVIRIVVIDVRSSKFDDISAPNDIAGTINNVKDNRTKIVKIVIHQNNPECPSVSGGKNKSQIVMPSGNAERNIKG